MLSPPRAIPITALEPPPRIRIPTSRRRLSHFLSHPRATIPSGPQDAEWDVDTNERLVRLERRLEIVERDQRDLLETLDMALLMLERRVDRLLQPRSDFLDNAS